MIETVSYLRNGRKLRASGTVVAVSESTGLFKVKPSRGDWGHIWLTRREIEAGRSKPPTVPRKAHADKSMPRKRRRRQKTRKPRWVELAEMVRSLEIDHHPEGWPAVKMKVLSGLADELERAHSKLREFLPLGHDQANTSCAR